MRSFIAIVGIYNVSQNPTYARAAHLRAVHPSMQSMPAGASLAAMLRLPFALLPLLLLGLTACPQAVPDSGRFGTADASAGSQDIGQLADTQPTELASPDQLAEAAPADAPKDAPPPDAPIEVVAQPDTLSTADDGAAAADADAQCLCVSDEVCDSIPLATCQVGKCLNCQCIVALAPEGSSCGTDKTCQSGTCLPAPGKGPWAKAIAAGGDTSCAIRPDSSVVCWGDNGSGQLGIGINSKDYIETTPQAVVGLVAVDGVALGSTHACALHDGGKVSCWGDRFNGKTGNGDNGGKALAPEPAKGLTDALSIATGSETSFAVRKGATLWGWGSGTGDPFATGKYTASTLPTQVMGGVLGVQKACGGYYHTCALAIGTGKVTCWGRNPDGQIGNGVIGDGNSAEPPTLVAGLPAVVDIACGHYHTCAWDAAGKTWCWGKNLSSQLGQGGYSQGIATPVAVKNLTDTQQLSGGQGHSCAVRKTGAVVCWGDNEEGESGQANFAKDVDLPSPIPLPAKVKAVACGTDHSCALLENGAVYCWGDGSDGQLGNGGKVDAEVPVAVAGSVPKG